MAHERFLSRILHIDPWHQDGIDGQRDERVVGRDRHWKMSMAIGSAAQRDFRWLMRERGRKALFRQEGLVQGHRSVPAQVVATGGLCHLNIADDNNQRQQPPSNGAVQRRR